MGLGHGIVDGGEHEVLQHLDVVRVGVAGRKRVGVDLHGAELHPAGHPHLHRATAGLPFDLGLGRGGLCVEELLLHLLRLLEQVAHVGHVGRPAWLLRLAWILRLA